MYYVYIITNKPNGILYIGVTSNLERRIHEHKHGLHEGFSKKYFCSRLVWFDSTDSVDAALNMEKRMKKWKRQWKINVIEEMNPNWDDLFDEISGD